MSQATPEPTHEHADPSQAHNCQYCGHATYEDVISLAVWVDRQLIVLDDVPARVCGSCFEQYYDDSITFQIDRLKGLRFPKEEAKKVLEVPVFSLEDFRNR